MADTNKEFVDFVNGKMKTDSPWSFVDAWAGKEAELLFNGKAGAIVAVSSPDYLGFWRNGAEMVENKVPFEKGGRFIETQKISPLMTVAHVVERKESGPRINKLLPVIICLPFGKDNSHSVRHEQHRDYANDLVSPDSSAHRPLMVLLDEAISEKGVSFGEYLFENGTLPQNMPEVMWRNRAFVDLVMAEEPYMLANIPHDTLSYEDGLKALKYEEAHMMIEEGAFNSFFTKFPAIQEEILAGDYGSDVLQAFKKWNESDSQITYEP